MHIFPCNSCLSKYLPNSLKLQWKLKDFLNVKNNDGMTPVYAAAIQGQDEVTEILLEHGSYADTVSKKMCNMS